MRGIVSDVTASQ